MPDLKVTPPPPTTAPFVREVSGLVVAAILIGVIVILSWGLLIGLWSGNSEIERARYVGLIGIGLTITLCVVFWTQNGGKTGKIEVRGGPASVSIESTPDQKDDYDARPIPGSD